MKRSTVSSEIERSFSRNIISLLGVPIDLHSYESISEEIKRAANNKTPIFLSTPNLNFLLLANRQPGFRQSLIKSDLVTIDGTPLLWLARILGISSVNKISGSSLFEHLQRKQTANPINVFLFGGDNLVAERAHNAINAEQYGVRSVGFLNPGKGSSTELSKQEFIDEINRSDADFLVLSLGAEKAQDWALKNRHKLNPPIVSHLGAVLGFTAGNIKRAPRIMQHIGAEWLWRIKEEPNLFRRYWSDGLGFLSLLTKNAIPYSLYKRKYGFSSSEQIPPLIVEQHISEQTLTIHISGPLVRANLNDIRSAFSVAATHDRAYLDFENVTYVDEYGFGQLLLLKKHLSNAVKIKGASARIKTAIAYESLNHMLIDHTHSEA